MNIAVLDTGLFPDRGTVEDALAELRACHRVQCCDATGAAVSDEQWSRVLDEILASDVVIPL